MKFIFALLSTIILSNAPALAATPKTEKEATPVEKALKQGVSTFEPENIFAWIEIPRETKINSTIKLKIEIQNIRQGKEFTITSIDIGKNLGDGFRVKKTSPRPTVLDTTLGEFELEYDLLVRPDTKKEFVIELEAIKVGTYKGEIDIWEGNNFLTRVAQCRIVK